MSKSKQKSDVLIQDRTSHTEDRRRAHQHEPTEDAELVDPVAQVTAPPASVATDVESPASSIAKEVESPIPSVATVLMPALQHPCDLAADDSMRAVQSGAERQACRSVDHNVLRHDALSDVVASGNSKEVHGISPGTAQPIWSKRPSELEQTMADSVISNIPPAPMLGDSPSCSPITASLILQTPAQSPGRRVMHQETSPSALCLMSRSIG